MCGTCGTDLKIFDGHFPMTPPFGEFTPGHEWTGTVVALGESVDELEVGDRVCIEAHHGCGRCDNCVVGKYTACLNYGNAGKGHRASGMTTDGGFAGVRAAQRELALPPARRRQRRGRGDDHDRRHGALRPRRDRRLHRRPGRRRVRPRSRRADDRPGVPPARREQRDARGHPREPAGGRAPLRRRPPRQRARARSGRGDHGDHRRARRRPRRRVLGRGRRAAAVRAGDQARRQAARRRVLPRARSSST